VQSLGIIPRSTFGGYRDLLKINDVYAEVLNREYIPAQA
jgi:hypothetical protein